MSQQDLRLQVAEMIQSSDLDDAKKQKMLFALPKMEEAEVKEIYEELKKVHEEEHAAIQQKIESEVMEEQQRDQALSQLAEEFDGQPMAAMNDEEAQKVSDEIMAQVADDPEKLTQLLIALGPKEMKKLEKAIERLGADPNYDFSEEDIKDTMQKLQDFSAKVYKASHELDQELEQTLLEEEVRLEKEKQEVLEGYLSDLNTITESA